MGLKLRRFAVEWGMESNGVLGGIFKPFVKSMEYSQNRIIKWSQILTDL